MQLVHAPPQLCLRKLQPGMVKRFPLRGTLAGYYIACPGCGFAALHLEGPELFVETGWTTRESRRQDGKAVAVAQPESLALAGDLRCIACKKLIRIEGCEISVAG